MRARQRLHVRARSTAHTHGSLSAHFTELPVDSVRVSLNGGAYTAIPRQDGSFKLFDVPPGTYLLEVLDTASVWPTVRNNAACAEVAAPTSAACSLSALQPASPPAGARRR